MGSDFLWQIKICHKKSVAKTLLRRADCLLSSLDSKAEERKYVSNVLKANGYTKTFLRNCQKPVTTSNALDEGEPATVIPYFQGVTEPIKRILNSHVLLPDAYLHLVKKKTAN